MFVHANKTLDALLKMGDLVGFDILWAFIRALSELSGSVSKIMMNRGRLGFQ
jgi:hypothetical protein